MSITNIQALHDLAETSLASYAYLDTDATLLRDLQTQKFGANFTLAQAQTFTTNYRLISTQPNIDSNGFSASVFEDTRTGEKVFAIRGTEFTTSLGQILTDGAVADVLGIGASGYANLQGLEMYRYWKKLTTIGGQAVSYTTDELLKLYALKLGPVAGAAALTTPLVMIASAGFIAFSNGLLADTGIDSGVAGQSVIAPGAKVNVTGHSLGGHLALLFARLFPQNVDEVVTLNAPTFFSQGDLFLNALDFPNSIGGKITRLEADGDGVSELGNVDPGTSIRIAQENKPGPLAAISTNHSSVNSVDGLALMAVMAKLDASKANNAVYFSDLIRASANTPDSSYEKLLDALRKALAGPNVEPLPIGDASDLPKRTQFYATLDALQKNPIFTSLAASATDPSKTSQLIIRLAGQDLRSAARNDFGALIALQDLSPIWITGKDATADAALATVWQTGRAADYAAWQADKTSATASTFTDQWMADRSQLLEAIMARNIKDGPDAYSFSTKLPTDRSYEFHYIDASGTDKTLIAENTARTAGVQTIVPSQLISFGGAGNDTLTGSDTNKLGDHLYGGAGDDTLDGKGGNDYLEGGAGTDTYQFTGSFGKDTLADSDGLGSIQLDGATLGIAKGAGQRNVWVADLGGGQYVGLAVYDNASSSTGKRLLITRSGDTNNTITIDNFDLAKALTSEGYLGIKLQGMQLALQSANTPSANTPSASNPFAKPATQINDVQTSLPTLSGKALKVYLSQGANEGDTVKLTLSGVQRRSTCKNARKYYKNHSCLGNKYAGYRQKRHLKQMSFN